MSLKLVVNLRRVFDSDDARLAFKKVVDDEYRAFCEVNDFTLGYSFRKAKSESQIVERSFVSPAGWTMKCHFLGVCYG